MPDRAWEERVVASGLGDRAGTLGAAAFFLGQIDVASFIAG